jgi:hypothetical protein
MVGEGEAGMMNEYRIGLATKPACAAGVCADGSWECTEIIGLDRSRSCQSIQFMKDGHGHSRPIITPSICHLLGDVQKPIMLMISRQRTGILP